MVHGQNNFDTVSFEKGSAQWISEKLAERMFWLSYDGMGPCCRSEWPLENREEMVEEYMGMEKLYKRWIDGLDPRTKEAVFLRARNRFSDQP